MKNYIFFCLLLFQAFIFGEGFIAGTLVKTLDGYIPIKQIQSNQKVLCYDFSGNVVESIVTRTMSKKAKFLICITLSNDEEITVDLNHLFYLPSTNQWTRIEKLSLQDYFLTDKNQLVHIKNLQVINTPSVVYDITVDKYHNFFVAQTGVLVHNVAPMIALAPAAPAAAIGAGKLVIAAGVAIGTAVSAAVVWIFDKFRGKKRHTHITNDAQAPGKPTEKDGFIPPKNWDGKKVRHPKTGQYGYPDNKGKVWVPTGPGGATPGTKGKAHGGPHWDVVDKNGKDYDNVYPGGKIRGAK